MTHRAGQRIAVGWRRRDVTALSVLLAAWCVYLAWTATAGGLGPGGRIATDPDKIALVRERIDPNTATAASLRRLPLIGPEKSKAIVQYRQAQPPTAGRVFEHLEDIQNVPGIGPGILRRVARHLSLPTGPATSQP